MKIYVPPIKSQGIKTKLIPLIQRVLPTDVKGRWIEPFMGTGCVGFNLASREATLSDSNPCLIEFYQSVEARITTPSKVRKFLLEEGSKLAQEGESRYYFVRDRFNKNGNPLDFLFLNRACFNGMIRFNRKGEFNTPFCRKPQRFAPAYVTKIVNQIERLTELFSVCHFTFQRRDFIDAIKEANKDDLIYCDPPYIDRYADYYNGWTEEDELRLFNALRAVPARFVLSTWSHNEFRSNQYVEKYWSRFNIVPCEHFYHLGGKEENRRAMVEALILNYDVDPTESKTTPSASSNVASRSLTPLFDFYSRNATL